MLFYVFSCDSYCFIMLRQLHYRDATIFSFEFLKFCDTEVLILMVLNVSEAIFTNGFCHNVMTDFLKHEMENEIDLVTVHTATFCFLL